MNFQTTPYTRTWVIACLILAIFGLIFTSCDKNPVRPPDPVPPLPASLSGTVTSTYEGGPVSNIAVTIADKLDASVVRTATTDAAGTFEIDSLAAGTYEIECEYEGHESYASEIKYDGTRLEVDIELRAIPFYVADKFYLPHMITAVGTGESGLWVGPQVQWGQWQIHLYDPSSLELLQMIPVDFRVSGLTQQGDILWVSTDDNPDQVRMIDLSVTPPAIGSPIIATSTYVGGLYWDGSRMFACESSGGGSSASARIQILDVDNALHVVASYAAPTAFPHSLVKVRDSYWLASSYPRSFHRLNAETMAVEAEYTPPFPSHSSYDVTGQMTWAGGYFFSYPYFTNVLYKMRDRW